MGIRRIEEAHYGVEDITECVRYFQDWGIRQVVDQPNRAEFETPIGQRVVLRPIDDPGLASTPEPAENGSTLREIVWGVETEAELREFADEISKDRDVTIDPDGTVHTHDNVGFGVGLKLANPAALDNEQRDYNATGFEKRWDDPIPRYGRAHPLRMCHVAYFIPADDWKGYVSFYVDKLRFRVTDQALDMGTFMQAENDNDQHTLLLGHRPGKTGFNHIAYEVMNFDEVVEGGNFMVSQGWKESRRFGRHVLGSNIFRFMFCPAGGRTEYAADMDRVDENYGPNIYEKRPAHHLWMLTTNGQVEELDH